MDREVKSQQVMDMKARQKKAREEHAIEARKADERKANRKKKYGYDYPPLIIDARRMASDPNKVLVRMKSRSVEGQPNYKQCPGVLELTIRDWEHFASKINWDFGEVPDIDKR